VRVCEDEEDGTVITEIVSKDSNDPKLLHGFAETLQVLMKLKMSVHEEYSFRGKQVTAIIAEGDISDGNLIQAMKNMLINPVNIEILPKERRKMMKVTSKSELSGDKLKTSSKKS